MFMEFQSRQLIHLFGVLAFFALIIWFVDLYTMRQPRPNLINLGNYYWLATVNLDYQSDVSKAAIRKGQATMLVVVRRDSVITHMHAKHHGTFEDPSQVLSLHHFDHNGDEVISAMDPLFKKLYLISYVDGEAQRVALDQSQIRAIHVHRDAKGRLQYSAVLSNGKLAQMKVAPSNQVYNPQRR